MGRLEESKVCEIILFIRNNRLKRYFWKFGKNDTQAFFLKFSGHFLKYVYSLRCLVQVIHLINWMNALRLCKAHLSRCCCWFALHQTTIGVDVYIPTPSLLVMFSSPSSKSLFRFHQCLRITSWTCLFAVIETKTLLRVTLMVVRDIYVPTVVD